MDNEERKSFLSSQLPQSDWSRYGDGAMILIRSIVSEKSVLDDGHMIKLLWLSN